MQVTKQIQVVSDQSTMDGNLGVERTAFFDEDGVPFSPASSQIAPLVTNTAIDTAAKVIADPAPPGNTIVVIRFANGNSATAPTVAFDGGSAIPIKLGGAASPAADITIAAEGVGIFWFDGGVLHQAGAITEVA